MVRVLCVSSQVPEVASQNLQVCSDSMELLLARDERRVVLLDEEIRTKMEADFLADLAKAVGLQGRE